MNVRMRVIVGLVLALAVLVCFDSSAFGQAEGVDTSGMTIDGNYGYGLPPDISVHGPGIDQLIHILHWFMVLLFVGWGIFMVRCLIKYRQRAGHKAVHGSVKAKPAKFLEVGVVVFETVLLLGFSIPIWGSIKNDLPEPTDNPLRLRVLAEQFAWNFHYPGEDGKFGKTAPKFIDAAMNPAGIDPGDPNGEDDIVSGAMHIPVNRPIICDISSKDVIHSFSLPVLRIKQDAIPGMRIPTWFQATKTGTYQVACAQLCGNNHYKMLAPLVIQSAEDFAAWQVEKSAPAEDFDEDEFED